MLRPASTLAFLASDAALFCDDALVSNRLGLCAAAAGQLAKLQVVADRSGHGLTRRVVFIDDLATLQLTVAQVAEALLFQELHGELELG